MHRLFVVELLSMRHVKAAWYSMEQHVDRPVAGLSRAAAALVALEEHIFTMPDDLIGTVVDDITAEDFFPNTVGYLIAPRECVFRELDGFFETVIDPAHVVPESDSDFINILISL